MWDVDTPDGMAKSKAWMMGVLGLLQPVADWGVPRSGTVYRIDQREQSLLRLFGDGDPSIEQVFAELGYTIKECE